MDNYGLSFCVSYYQDRCSIYADPYRLCFHHGLETDLLNLTACWGYELWRFSTTCTLVIESVKATSVIFLLGFGSFVCYKLYSHYRKKPGGPGSNRRLRLLKWGSRELLDSSTDLDSDLQNIETKYFGPDEITNEEQPSECTSRRTSSSLTSDPEEDSFRGETASAVTENRPEMGNFNCQYEPVLYSPQTGINFSDNILAGQQQEHSPSSPSSPPTKPFSISSPRSGGGGGSLRQSNRKFRRFNFNSLIAKQREKEAPAETPSDCHHHHTSRNGKVMPPGLNEDVPLLLNDDDRSFYYGPSRHSSEADIESLGSPAYCENYYDEDDEDFENDADCEGSDQWGQDGASLRANCSLRSLAERSSFLTRLPPDGSDSLKSPEFEINRDSVFDEDITTPDPLKEAITFGSDDLGLDSDSEVLTSSEGKIKRGRLVRELSHESGEGSDYSLDVSLRTDIGLSTVARVDHLLSHVHEIKQSCQHLDAHIVSLKVDKQPPPPRLAFTISDSSDNSFNNSSSSAMNLVHKHKRRASLKGLIDEGSEIKRFDKDVSGAEAESNSSEAMGTKISMEWDSPDIQESDSKKKTGSKKKRGANKTGVSPGVTSASGTNGTIDSGSDFGTPLTSESPDLVLMRTESSASLEWDEEFSPAEVDDVASVTDSDNNNIIHNLRDPRLLQKIERERRIKQLSLDNDETLLEGSLSLSDVPKTMDSFDSPLGDRIVMGQSKDSTPSDGPPVCMSTTSSMLSTSVETVESYQKPREIPNTLGNLEQAFEMGSSKEASPIGGDGSCDSSCVNANLQLPSPHLWPSSESGFDDEAAEANNVKNFQDSVVADDAAGEEELMSTPKMEAKRRRPKKRRNGNKANRDSAYCEGKELNVSRMQENVGEKWDLIQYCDAEWRGQTQRAETIRKGYGEIPSKLGCFHLRRIRGDNYCAIRASLFQSLLQGIPIMSNYGGLTIVIEKLKYWMENRYQSLQNWSFGNRLPYSQNTCLQGFRDCLECLEKLTSESVKSSSREEFIVDQLNSDPDFDVRLMEAVKLLMFVASAELHEATSKGEDTPIFAMLLFARETSDNPQTFIQNHLNLVGDSGGLEQIEMFLLGYTLGVTLQVVRPSCFGSYEYVCCYPDDNIDVCPKVNLIAEDDRHYNVIMK